MQWSTRMRYAISKKTDTLRWFCLISIAMKIFSWISDALHTFDKKTDLDHFHGVNS